MKLTPEYFENVKRKRPGKYALVGKTQVYYEIYGSGHPLFIFHGGLSCIDGLRYQIPFFAQHFKVILPERPGHGHTADIPGNYTFEFFARHTAAFMDKLKIKKASVIGYSDGANLIYALAAKRPDLVKRFISVGGNFHHSGCEPSFQKELRKQKRSRIGTDPRYAAYSPDGEGHYPAVYAKCRKLWLTEPKWKRNFLKKIKAPGLLLAGDRDMIRPEHTLDLFRSLPNAQMAIIPGTSHSLLKEKPRVVNPLMLDFLKQKPQKPL